MQMEISRFKHNKQCKILDSYFIVKQNMATISLESEHLKKDGVLNFFQYIGMPNIDYFKYKWRLL